ncbi:MAG: hypothetical protein QXS38_00875 [Candidatus Pacearchaeota archaeon]
MKPNPRLVKFIREAKKRGFDDYQIRNPLIKEGWGIDEIEAAFYSLRPSKPLKYKFKNKVEIFLDNDVLKMIEKRAKRNMLTLPEQIEDILRRSCVSMKQKPSTRAENLDDLLVSIFSRKNHRNKKTK